MECRLLRSLYTFMAGVGRERVNVHKPSCKGTTIEMRNNNRGDLAVQRIPKREVIAGITVPYRTIWGRK